MPRTFFIPTFSAGSYFLSSSLTNRSPKTFAPSSQYSSRLYYRIASRYQASLYCYRISSIAQIPILSRFNSAARCFTPSQQHTTAPAVVAVLTAKMMDMHDVPPVSAAYIGTSSATDCSERQFDDNFRTDDSYRAYPESIQDLFPRRVDQNSRQE
jgi:hypothetical protein